VTAGGLSARLSPRSNATVNVGLHIGVVLLIAIAVSRLGGQVPHAPVLPVGSCFDSFAMFVDEQPETIRIPCDVPHFAEVFHVFDLDAPPDASYPSGTEWADAVQPVCDAAFAGYTGRADEETDEIGVDWYPPNLTDWQAGGRRVTCYLFRWDLEPLEGSMKAEER
jgi:hypothetical protein